MPVPVERNTVHENAIPTICLRNGRVVQNLAPSQIKKHRETMITLESLGIHVKQRKAFDIRGVIIHAMKSMQDVIDDIEKSSNKESLENIKLIQGPTMYPNLKDYSITFQQLDREPSGDIEYKLSVGNKYSTKSI